MKRGAFPLNESHLNAAYRLAFCGLGPVEWCHSTPSLTPPELFLLLSLETNLVVFVNTGSQGNPTQSPRYHHGPLTLVQLLTVRCLTGKVILRCFISLIQRTICITCRVIKHSCPDYKCNYTELGSASTGQNLLMD